MMQNCLTEDGTITVKIPENIEVGSIICRLFDVIVPRPNKHTVYTLIKNPFFAIKDNEKVVVIGAIDRDNNSLLCTERRKIYSCVWKHLLFSSNGVHLMMRVAIEDQNDNHPKWVDDVMRIDISENIDISLFSMELPKAYDPDQAPNNTVSYVIEPPSKYLYIYNNNMTTGLTPLLRLRHSIDREILKSHNVTVLAIDGGQPPLSGSLTLLISITDVNDNYPVFESSFYRHSLGKSIKANDRLDLNIKATDPDDGLNGNVIYSLSLNSPFLIKNCLTVDPHTAIVIIIKSFTGHCLLSEYRFTITASDRGNPVLSSKTVVLLSFDSKNLYPPDIQISNKEPILYIFENNEVGYHLSTIAVHDKDSGRNGLFECSLRGNNTNKFSLIPKRNTVGHLTIIELVAMGVLDREVAASLFFSIVCKDFGEPSLSSTKNLQIDIVDLNDNRPHFKEKSYQFKVYEENEPYQILAQLTAHDADEGYNSMLTYHIESSMSPDITSRLTMDINGNIIAKERLDREAFEDGFHFTVVATDQGHPHLKGSTEVHLQLLDINDNSPIFLKQYYNFSFAEDDGSIHQSRLLGYITAIDADIGNNSKVTYTMVFGSPLPFKLNQESGQLYSYSLVDREIKTSPYVFAVLAMDQPSNLLYRRSTTVSVSIEISDLNDNSPIFVFPNDENNRVQLSYLSPVGTIVTTVKAIDKDEGMNAKVLYSLVDPDRYILFSINQSSGQIFISTVLNSIHEGVENLFIRASDCGSPPLTAIQRLLVEIREYKSPLNEATINKNPDKETFLSDQATYIIVGIVLGTFFICCGLVTGICTMTYRQWRATRPRAPSMNAYLAVGDQSLGHIYSDNYLEMKEII